MESELSDMKMIDDWVEEQPEDQRGTSILDLNQHCLLQVFGHLDVYEAINFGETCKTLHTVSRLAMTKYKNFVLTDYLIEMAGDFTQTVGERSKLAVSLTKILTYVAPHIELLDARTQIVERVYNMKVRYDPEVMRKRTQQVQIFSQFDMPKLKSLVVENSDHMAYIINRRTIKKLTIYDLNANDLHNYASDMRNLTQLHLFNIYPNVTIEEISVIVENNPNIEDLCLIAEKSFTLDPPRELSVNSILNLPHLKHLELSFGPNMEILAPILQMQHLTKLSLVSRNRYSYDGNHLDIFLKKLAEMGKLRSLELKAADFIIDNNLLGTVASMNLTSLLIEKSSYNGSFLRELTRVKFYTLKNLQISSPLTSKDDLDGIILIIEHFQSLVRLIFSNSTWDFDPKKLSKGIDRLLKVVPTTRPDFELVLAQNHGRVKISFRRGNYEILSSLPFRTEFF